MNTESTTLKVASLRGVNTRSFTFTLWRRGVLHLIPSATMTKHLEIVANVGNFNYQIDESHNVFENETHYAITKDLERGKIYKIGYS